MADRDGNGWVRCRLGHRHWGRFGAAGMLLYAPPSPAPATPAARAAPAAGAVPAALDLAPGAEPQVLLQQRAWWSHHGGTWGLPGGARDSHESAISAALREAAEECAVPPDAVTVRGLYIDDHGGWSYDTLIAQARSAFPAHPASDETIATAWISASEVSSLDLHPGFAAHWPELREVLRPLTVIVDAANVMGSRPDGWWRDRAGAALRLRGQLAGLAGSGLAGASLAGLGIAGSGRPADGRPGHGHSAVLPAADLELPALERWFPDVLLVVEGAARPAAAAPDAPLAGGRLRVVAAAGSGDDTIAELAAQLPGWRLVVTADRELRSRAVAAAAAVTGPRWLLAQL